MRVWLQWKLANIAEINSLVVQQAFIEHILLTVVEGLMLKPEETRQKSNNFVL